MSRTRLLRRTALVLALALGAAVVSALPAAAADPGVVRGHIHIGEVGTSAATGMAFAFLRGPDNILRTSGVDSVGDFRFDNVIPGNPYELSFQSNYSSYQPAQPLTFAVTAGETVIRDVVFKSYAFLEGVVVDFLGYPAEAVVEAYRCATGAPAGWTFTASDGSYLLKLFNHLGPYTVVAYGSDGVLASLGPSAERTRGCVDVSEGGEFPRDFVLPEGGTIRGRVTVAGVATTALFPDTIVRADRLHAASGVWEPVEGYAGVQTDGTYDFSFLFPGIYRLWAVYDGPTGTRESAVVSPIVLRGSTRTTNLTVPLPPAPLVAAPAVPAVAPPSSQQSVVPVAPSSPVSIPDGVARMFRGR